MTAEDEDKVAMGDNLHEALEDANKEQEADEGAQDPNEPDFFIKQKANKYQQMRRRLTNDEKNDLML